MKHSIPQYSSISHSVTELFAGIIGIALDGVHSAAITGFHNPYMVCHTISSPVEVNYRAGSRDAVSILPLVSGAEPFHAGGAVGMLRDNAGLNITALVGAPTHKTGAPFHARTESIPAPIGLPTHIAHLTQCHGYNIVAADTRHRKAGP